MRCQEETLEHEACTHEALPGASHCELHTYERLVQARAGEKEALPRLEQIAVRLVHLGLELEGVQRDLHGQRQLVLSTREQIERYESILAAAHPTRTPEVEP